MSDKRDVQVMLLMDFTISALKDVLKTAKVLEGSDAGIQQCDAVIMDTLRPYPLPYQRKLARRVRRARSTLNIELANYSSDNALIAVMAAMQAGAVTAQPATRLAYVLDTFCGNIASTKEHLASDDEAALIIEKIIIEAINNV